MKLVHLSDIHIHDQEILGQDPVENFKACWAHVEAEHADADLVIISGDLTHYGHKDSYKALKALLADTALAPKLIIGNHDDRQAFRSVFPQVRVDVHGHVQYAVDTNQGRFLFLDTKIEGTHAGGYGADRQAWLISELDGARAEGVLVYLVMHHHPCAVGDRSADEIGLVDGAEFRSILRTYRETVRHIFFGHCHFSLSGAVHGIPFSAPRSTNHPNASALDGRNTAGTGPIAPNYNVVLIEADSVVVHTVDFLVEPLLVWLPFDADGWVEDGTGSRSLP